MNADPKGNFIRCADEMRRIYWSGLTRKMIAMFLIWGFFAAIGWAVHGTWLQILGLLVIIATIVGRISSKSTAAIPGRFVWRVDSRSAVMIPVDRASIWFANIVVRDLQPIVRSAR